MKLPVEKCKELRLEGKEKREVIGFSKRIETLPSPTPFYLGHFFLQNYFLPFLTFCQYISVSSFFPIEARKNILAELEENRPLL
jgi:hypothetical protein